MLNSDKFSIVSEVRYVLGTFFPEELRLKNIKIKKWISILDKDKASL